jgi:hypothetical protein
MNCSLNDVKTAIIELKTGKIAADSRLLFRTVDIVDNLPRLKFD